MAVAVKQRQRSRPSGIRMTKVGLWFTLLTVLVAVAATNTGNNALYMALAAMLSVLALSGVVSRNNLRGIEVELEPPAEMFANTPFHVHYRVTNRSRLLPRSLLLLSLVEELPPVLVAALPRRGHGGVSGDVELLLKRRGLHRLESVRVWSLFPLGFFRKGARLRVEAELLVYPEIFSAASCEFVEPSRFGEEPRRRPGWGHDLHALRAFRPGDDPRSIHWKHTARTGSMVLKERQAEESRRLLILLDNAVGELDDAATEARFERLVSEAATAAVDHLARGYEVELLTRDRRLPFGTGRRQRLDVLETLALLKTRPLARGPLVASANDVPQLRLVLESPHRPGRPAMVGAQR